MFGTLGGDLRLKPLERGILGFKQGAQIVVEDLVLGRLDYGGEHMRGWVRADLSGGGCEWVTNWAAADSLDDLANASIRRVDVALTTWKGEVTHDQVVKAHQLGRFTVRRPPVLQTIESSDPCAGRTCYIGNRETSDKFMRTYEKGYEMMKGLPPGIDRSAITLVDGFAPAGIYRCEVEFKPVTCDIPWHLIARRDEFFAGAYPFCADVLPGVDADILQRRPERVAQTSLAIAMENIRIQYGATLFTAMVAHGGDFMAVWDKIAGTTHNQALLEKGVLLVDH